MSDTKLISDDESFRLAVRSMRLRLWLMAGSGILIGVVIAWLLVI
ncbi:MAG: hypothetical protein OXK76_07570 [Gammaproteobacteria bacterium]|nr:hypothetical protein [Gammaproteobacteria bacterium]